MQPRVSKLTILHTPSFMFKSSHYIEELGQGLNPQDQLLMKSYDRSVSATDIASATAFPSATDSANCWSSLAAAICYWLCQMFATVATACPSATDFCQLVILSVDSSDANYVVTAVDITVGIPRLLFGQCFFLLLVLLIVATGTALCYCFCYCYCYCYCYCRPSATDCRQI